MLGEDRVRVGRGGVVVILAETAVPAVAWAVEEVVIHQASGAVAILERAKAAGLTVLIFVGEAEEVVAELVKDREFLVDFLLVRQFLIEEDQVALAVLDGSRSGISATSDFPVGRDDDIRLLDAGHMVEGADLGAIVCRLPELVADGREDARTLASWSPLTSCTAPS